MRLQYCVRILLEFQFALAAVRIDLNVQVHHSVPAQNRHILLALGHQTQITGTSTLAT